MHVNRNDSAIGVPAHARDSGICRWIGMVPSAAFQLLSSFWPVVRFRQRRKNPSMSAAGLDGGMYHPNAVAASLAWQQTAHRVAEVPISLDTDAAGGASAKGGSTRPADHDPDSEPGTGR